MFTPYHITIRNQTGKTQNYTCVTAAPKLTDPKANAVVFENVLFPSCATPPGARVHFNVTHQHYLVWDAPQGSGKDATTAAAAAAADAAVSAGDPVQISQARAVKLGGGLAGSTFYVVFGDDDDRETVWLQDHVAVGVGEKAVVADTGDLKFRPRRGEEDTIEVAIRTSKNSQDYQTIGTFTPAPDVTYFVPPPPSLVVVCGESLMAGQIVDVKKVAKSAEVDFAVRAGRTVNLVDGKEGFVFV